MVPVALGGVALAVALYERAALDPELRATGGTGGPAIAALSALAAYLLALPRASVRAHVLAALVAGAVWLSLRAARQARLGAPLVCLAGFVTGLAPLVGLALAPLLLGVLRDALSDERRGRALLRLSIVHAVGGALGYALASPSPAHALDGARALAWVSAAAHAAGVAALAVAAVGLLLGVLGPAPRRAIAWTAMLLLAGEIAAGAVGPVSCVAIATGVGLALVEAAARVAQERSRAALALLAPLVLLIVAEPLSARLSVLNWSTPDLGPVPPRAELAPPSRRSVAAPRR